MADLSTNLQRLQTNAANIETYKTQIAAAITAKGGTVNPSDGLHNFPGDINTIPAGVAIPTTITANGTYNVSSGTLTDQTPPISIVGFGDVTDYTINGSVAGVGDLITDAQSPNVDKYSIPINLSSSNQSITPTTSEIIIDQPLRKSIGTFISREINFNDLSNSILTGSVSDIRAYTNRRRCIVADDGTVVAYYGDANYTEDGSLGQVMVEQPKFYYKMEPLELVENVAGDAATHGYGIVRARYSISDTPIEGFKLHPAFINEAGNETDYYYIGAYEACAFNVSENAYNTKDLANVDRTATTGDKLSSIANAKPMSGYQTVLDVPTTETLAKNRGDGWHSMSFKAASAEQMLLLVELGGDSQTAIGNGVINQADGTANMSAITGSTSSLGNASGVASSSTVTVYDYTDGSVVSTADLAAAYRCVSYRGCENEWGNIWKWTCGMTLYGDGNMRGGLPFLCNDFSYVNSWSGTVPSNYGSAGFTATNSGNYIKYFGYGNPDYDWVFIASLTGAISDSVVKDYNYVTSNLNGYKAARLGGHWTHSSSAGVFFWNLDIAASARHRVVGARLMYVPQVSSTSSEQPVINSDSVQYSTQTLTRRVDQYNNNLSTITTESVDLPKLSLFTIPSDTIIDIPTTATPTFSITYDSAVLGFNPVTVTVPPFVQTIRYNDNHQPTDIIINNNPTDSLTWMYLSSSIKSVEFKSTPTSLSQNFFTSATSLETVYVPWSENDVAGYPWGAPNTTHFVYDYPNISASRTINYENDTTSTTGSVQNLRAYNMMGRCTVSDDGTITSFYGDTSYTEDGSNGQVMVYIPKFYYKVNITDKQLVDSTKPEYGYDIHEATYSISDIQLDGYKLHPAFVNANGDEVDYVLCSAFEGSTYDTSASAYNTNDAQTVDFTATTGDLLSSIGYVDSSGTTVHVKPASGLTQNLTRPNSMTIAKNRGTGWYALTFKLTSAIQMLITVEYGCNSQVNIANGVVSITDNTSYNCASYVGSTIGNTTGRAASTINEINGTETTYTSATTTSVNYRGIENMWGNIWKWVDGINIYGNGSQRGGVPYVCTDMNFSDTNTDNYESVGFTVANTDGYVKYFGWGNDKYDWVFMPSTAGSGGASASTTVDDYFYITTNLNGYRAARLGGRWANSSYAGVFDWYLNFAASARSRNLGARLMYVPM